MSYTLKLKDGIWYWSDGNPSDATRPAALYGVADGAFLAGPLGASPTPPAGEVLAPRSITFTLPGAPGVTVMATEDSGNLDFQLKIAGPKADLSGVFFDFTQSKLASLSVVTHTQFTQFLTGTGAVLSLANGVSLSGALLNGAPVAPFDSGIEFGKAGVSTSGLLVQSATFVLTDPKHDLTLNDLHPAGEFGAFGISDVGDGQKLVTVAPYAPQALNPQVSVPEDTSVTIQASTLVQDQNPGATFKITQIGTGAKGPQYGTVTVAPDGQSLIYKSTTLDYLVDGLLTNNQDAFQVAVTDSLGGTVTSFVTINSTPVADAPAVSLSLLAAQPGDPATRTRFLLQANTEDFGTINNGSDFLKSIGLSLSGNVTNGVTFSDTAGLLAGNTINLAGLQGNFTDTIIVTTPSTTSVNDTLTATATAAETENPAVTANGSASQQIVIDQSVFSQQVNFAANNQSIWQTGPAFTFDWNQFLGIDTSFGGTFGGFTGSSVGLTTGATLGASLSLKAGFQANLHITGGNFDAVLPFQITLNDIYNKTTNELEIDPTFSVLSGGSLTTTGPGGSFSLDAIFNALLKLSAGVFVAGVGGSTHGTTGASITKNIASFTSGQLHFQHSFGPVNVSLAWPQVNTVGSPTGPGTLSSSGTSQTALGVTVDLVALALDALGIPQNVIKGDIAGIINYDLLSGNVGFGAALGQSFNLDATGLSAVLDVGTSNTPEAFTFGSPTYIDNISSLGLNPNGTIPLSLNLTPSATLQNITSIVPQFLASLTVGKISAGPVSATLAHLSTAVPLAHIPVYNNTFAANFQSQAASTSVG